MENGTITYDIDVKDLIDVFEEHGCAKIEFYGDGTYAIMSWHDYDCPDEAVHTEEYYLTDFEECGGNIKDYVEWLEDLCNDVDVYEHGEFLATIHINWLYEN